MESRLENGRRPFRTSLDISAINVLANQLANEAIAEATALSSSVRLAFHEKCGSLVKLTHDNRTAQRLRPTGEFNNGVVMTNRPIKPDELFEIQLDTMVDKWSGSIEVGITTHNPSLLDFPATMTNMRSGTIMMSGCGILTNGKGTQREYGQFNLDELAVGDRIGLIRKSNGHLHFYINGVDQGIASESAPEAVWGVVDLYGMAVKVTILEDGQEPDSASEDESVALLADSLAASAFCLDHNDSESDSTDQSIDDNCETEKLAFHPVCGSNVVVFNRNRSAKRPNARDEFNFGVVLSNRPLKPGETFEIQIDKVVDKWAGSLEIGVTTHDPLTLDFPATMTNARTGTWMMTGNGIIHNGVTIIEDYEESLDRTKPGDRIGVVRKEDGNLYFTLNGTNLGLAATNVPATIYGVLDLYGQTAEASLVHPDADRDSLASETTERSDLRFHDFYHGPNCMVHNNSRSASRPRPHEEFNESVVVSSRKLRPCELFEVVIDKTVERWNGSLEMGVTTLSPERLGIHTSSTATCDAHAWRRQSWMLGGSSIIESGEVTRSAYPLNLDSLDRGSRIGLLVTSEGVLHYFHNGHDVGPACRGIPQGVWVTLEVYGACAAVTLTRTTGQTIPMDRPIRSNDVMNRRPQSLRSASQAANEQTSKSTKFFAEPAGIRFSRCCGKNIELSSNYTTARRSRGFDSGVVFSADPIKPGELFEVRISDISRQWSGTLSIGLTTIVVSDTSEPGTISQNTASELHLKQGGSKHTWIITQNKVMLNGVTLRENYVSLDALDVGTRVGVRRAADGTMHLYINGVDRGIAAHDIPKNVFAVVDIYGSVEEVTLVNHSKNSKRSPEPNKSSVQNTKTEIQELDTVEGEYAFSTVHGKNINLVNKFSTARRANGFNKSLIFSSQPLLSGQPFNIKIDELNEKWTNSLMIGVTLQPPSTSGGSGNASRSTGNTSRTAGMTTHGISNIPNTFYCKSTNTYSGLKKSGRKLNCDIDQLQEGDKISLVLDRNHAIHLHLNSVDQGVLIPNITKPCYPVVDLYGKCTQVTICNAENEASDDVKEDKEKADVDNSSKEKISFMGPVNCEYHQACERFRQCVGLPDEFFKFKFHKCFCENCHKARGGTDYKLCGNPHREYSQPVGWCRFGIRVKPRCKTLRIFDVWNVAFCGVKLESVRQILDSSDLLVLADNATGDQSSIFAPSEERLDEKPETFESVPLILSPSIKYAGSNHFTQPLEYRDSKTNRLYRVRLAVQTRVKPNSYNMAPQSLDAPTDSRLKSTEIEWTTKEKGSVEVYGLLVKLDS